VRGTTNPVMRRVCGSRNNHIQGKDGGIPQQIIRQQESKYKRERHSQSVETPQQGQPCLLDIRFRNLRMLDLMPFELQGVRIAHFKQKYLHLFLL